MSTHLILIFHLKGLHSSGLMCSVDTFSICVFNCMMTSTQTSPLMLSVAIHCLLTWWLVLSTRGASILQLHRGSSSSRSVSPASLPSAKRSNIQLLLLLLLFNNRQFNTEEECVLFWVNYELKTFFFNLQLVSVLDRLISYM